MAIGTLVKTIQDIMRKDVGVDGDAQRISQMVWLIFLKIFDDKEQEWQLTVPGYKSPLPKPIALDKLGQRCGRHHWRGADRFR